MLCCRRQQQGVQFDEWALVQFKWWWSCLQEYYPAISRIQFPTSMFSPIFPEAEMHRDLIDKLWVFIDLLLAYEALIGPMDF